MSADAEPRQAGAAPADNLGIMANPPGRASKADATRTLAVGDAAPDFSLSSHTGETFRLADARGSNVVIAFYPAAFTGT